MFTTFLVFSVTYIVVGTSLDSNGSDLPPSCDSKIYCQGDLLHDVQLSEIFEDSKTFVDLMATKSEDEVLSAYEDLKKNNPDGVPNEVLKIFVNDNFVDCAAEPGCEELMPWKPTDWNPSPQILSKIKSKLFRKWAAHLNDFWKALSRIMSPDVEQKEGKTSSLIYVPNGLVIPGGRFKELYYWDTYWVIRGLLLCEMKTTVKGMIENFFTLVRKIGHIPNGSRVYYKQRSQPPLLTQMVEAYFEATNDMEFIKNNIDIISKELNFFVENRRVKVEKSGETYELFRYYAPSDGPRPESYREDYRVAKELVDRDAQDFYTNIKSAAESGLDFSSRWFIFNNTNKGNLSHIEAIHIIPCDLNAFLYKDFKLLSDWHKRIGNTAESEKYEILAAETLLGIEKVLWNEEDKIWYDYNIIENQPRVYFYLTNFAPLWTGAHRIPTKDLSEYMLSYVKKYNFLRYPGGAPTSMEYSNEQWDYPNAWPPLQGIYIQGLDRIGTEEASEMAFKLAQNWILSNYYGYMKHNKMYEKYNSVEFGEGGAGGEYAGQDGFGWTNGIVFEFLDRWGKSLSSQQPTVIEQ